MLSLTSFLVKKLQISTPPELNLQLHATAQSWGESGKSSILTLWADTHIVKQSVIDFSHLFLQMIGRLEKTERHNRWKDRRPYKNRHTARQGCSPDSAVMERLWEECQEYVAQLEKQERAWWALGQAERKCSLPIQETLFITLCPGMEQLDCFSLAIAPRHLSCRDAGDSQELWNPLGSVNKCY